MLRWLLIGGFSTSAGLLAYQMLNPIHSRLNHLILLVAIGGMVICLGVVLGRKWWLVLIALVLAVAPFLLPGGEIDRARLGQRYLVEMEQLEGTKYVWGGESSRGIDCSGLPRLALRRALLAEGLYGDSLREWARLWWQDLSAQAMGEGFKDFTRPVGIHGKLNELNSAALTAGDLAVTDSGIHVLVYQGEGRWIQADPGPGRVTIGDPQVDDSGWFISDVSIHRWSLLDKREVTR